MGTICKAPPIAAIASGVALLLAFSSASGAATPPVASTTAPRATPANSVQCVFDKLSIEDQEITLLLIGLDFIELGRYARTAPPNPIVDRLVLEALPRCAALNHWSARASSAAVEYAHTLLVQEVLRQALAYEELTPEPIEAFFAQNHDQLAANPELDDALEDSFASQLDAKGWKSGNRAARRLAKVYLQVLIVKDSTASAFSQSQPRASPSSRPPRRAGKGSRGKP